MARALYLDASAIVKTVVDEPESRALARLLRRFPIHVSCSLARAEVLRAVRRHGAEALGRSHEAMRRLVLVGVDDALLVSAGMLEPESLRTLDAVHLAAALAVVDDLAAVVTYDRRMAEAAEHLGLAVAAPV